MEQKQLALLQEKESLQQQLQQAQQLLIQSFVQTCHLRCPQLTPTHTFPEGPWSGREAQLELVKEQFALEKKQEAKGKQCNLKGVITPRRSNLRCLLPSLMVQTECTRTVQSIACCILLEKSEIEFHEKYDSPIV